MTKSHNFAGWLVAMLIAAFYCWLNFPKDFITGTGPFWLTQNEDVTQYIAGFWAYLNSDWQFPLLAIPSLDWPNGTIVTFVDGIPVVAMLAKLIHTTVGLNEHVFGYWVLACVLLQATATWYVMRIICPRNWPLLIIAVSFTTGMAAFWARIGHLSLMAHFIVIFALGFYFNDKKSGKIHLTMWIVLLTLTFFINFYIFVMAFGIYTASVLDSGGRRGALKYALPLLIIAVLFPVLMGMPFSKVKPDTGFGIYAMNLLSPFYGGSVVRVLNQFYTPEVHTQGFAYEGFNYLGFGLMAVVVIALFIARNELKLSWLLALMLGFTFYSLSNRIYAGPVEVLTYPVPHVLQSITETFRSSGRFFWPVAYLLVFASCIGLSRLSESTKWALAAILVAVQFYDVYPHYVYAREYMSRKAVVILDKDEWRPRLSGVKTLYHYPKFKCGDDGHHVTLPVEFVAVSAGVNLSTGFISRYGPQCDAERAEIAGSDVATSAYTFDSKKYSLEQIRSWLPADVPCEQASERIIFCRLPGANAPQ